MSDFTVLTIDGGGMRGLYSATLLAALVRRFNPEPKEAGDLDLGKKCNLICGTSTGAIIACGLVAGVPLQDIMKLYTKHGEEIFPRGYPKSICASIPWIFKHLCKPSADKEKLHSVLQSIFKEETINGIYNKRKIAFCIPTVNATTYKAWVFKTPHLAGKHRDNQYKLVDVCMASAAAPILFPLHSISNPENENDTQIFVDGGLWANNPVLLALVEAIQIAPQDADINIISVGTASTPNGDPKKLKNCKWGIGDWKFGMESMEMAITAQAYGYDSAAKFLSNTLSELGRTVRLERLEETHKSPEHYSAIGVDKADESAIRTLSALAEDDANNIHSNHNGKTDSIVRNFFKL